MDGVTPEHNMRDNLSDFWSDSSESAEVEAAADDLIFGTRNARSRFGRAGGDPLELRMDIGLLRWLGFMFKQIYTPRLTAASVPDSAFLPLNPFTVIQDSLRSFSRLILQQVCPQLWYFDFCFMEKLRAGVYLDCNISELNICLPVTDFTSFFATETLLSQPSQAHVLIGDDSAVLSGPQKKAQPSDPALTTEESLADDQPADREVAEPAQTEHLPPIDRMIQNEQQHVDTTLLRRSTRCNKYSGFRVPPPSDKKAMPSKVKPRKAPFIQCSSSATEPAPVQPSDGHPHGIPPPTAITTIQCIGSNMCGIPSDQLSPKKLLASLQEEGEDRL